MAKQQHDTLHLILKSQFGRKRYFPDNDTAHKFLWLVNQSSQRGRTAFAKEELEAIEELGFKIDVSEAAYSWAEELQSPKKPYKKREGLKADILQIVSEADTPIEAGDVLKRLLSMEKYANKASDSHKFRASVYSALSQLCKSGNLARAVGKWGSGSWKYVAV